MQEELIDTLRGVFFFLWIWSFFPCIFANGSNLATDKMEIEIRGYRLQQFEYSGKSFGSRSWKVLYEAVSINESMLRKCVIVHWRDLIGKDIDAKFSAAIGAVLVVVPEHLDGLPPNERQNFIWMEQKFAVLRTQLAVYFAPNSPQLKYLLKNVAATPNKAPSALLQIVESIAANNFQITSSNSATSNLASAKTYNIIGHLNSGERGRPYIFIVAHYDTHAIVPALAVGADSNGSGVAALLELLVLLSRFYASSEHRPRYNIVFALTSGGKFSYQGSRGFIDDFNEKHADDSIALAICLDGLARGNILNAHVSKTLTEGTAFRLIQHLKKFANEQRPVEMVPKKINLSADRLAWEHEIYNIRRIHSLTLSHFNNHSDPLRNSLLDTRAALNMDVLERNVKLIANAIVAFLFDLDSSFCQDAKNNAIECSLVGQNNSGVSRERLLAWVDSFATRPRPIAVPMNRLVTDLHEVVRRYAHSSHTSEVAINDFILYDILEDKLVANVVKPAIFELFLAALISAYLFGIYYLAAHAQMLIERTVIKLKKIS